MFKTNTSGKMGTTGADRKENTSVKIVDGGFNLWLPPEAAAPRDVEKRTSLSTLAAEVRVLLHSQSHGSDYEPSAVETRRMTTCWSSKRASERWRTRD